MPWNWQVMKAWNRAEIRRDSPFYFTHLRLHDLQKLCRYSDEMYARCFRLARDCRHSKLKSRASDVLRGHEPAWPTPGAIARHGLPSNGRPNLERSGRIRRLRRSWNSLQTMAPVEIASVFMRDFESAMQIGRERFLGAGHYAPTCAGTVALAPNQSGCGPRPQATGRSSSN